MKDPSSYRLILNPSWVRESKICSGDICRGVLYTGLEPWVLLELLKLSRLVQAWAAVGPRLFWQREDGPFVPYDRDLIDQNIDAPVRERPWPWCWGDEIWALATWDLQPLYLHWEMDWCEILLGSPGPSSTIEAISMVRGIVTRATGTKFSVIPRSDFLFRVQDSVGDHL